MLTNKLRLVLMSVVLSMFLQGCGVSSFFTLGENQTASEEEGNDYSDAGISENPYDIVGKKLKANKKSYEKFPLKKAF